MVSQKKVIRFLYMARKDTKQEVEELSEEDQTLKTELEMLVSRLQV